jgi:DNA polymerase-3 subunit delta'
VSAATAAPSAAGLAGGGSLDALAASAGGALGRAAASLARAIAERRLGHAYLLVGPTGAGKGTLARALAAALLGRIRADGTHPDLTTLAPEEGKREIGIDAVRAACAEMALAPLEAPGRVALVLGADLLGEEAANALLKTLEEPPEGAVLVLTTTRPEAVLPTIRSRCMALRLPARGDALAEEGAAAAEGPGAEVLRAAREAGAALAEPGGDPFGRAARASEAAAALASAAEGGAERPSLERRRRAALVVLDAAAARLAGSFRERARAGTSFAFEEAALERIGAAARRIEANATPDLVLEVLALDVDDAGRALAGTARGADVHGRT